MIYLVDTNVLLRSIQQGDPLHADARRAAATLTRQDQQLSIVAQNLIEFWAVATRPAVNNGLALSIDDTAQHVAIFKRIFTLLPDTRDILSEWERLVNQHKVIGRQVHDARLVAAMKVHSITHLLTFQHRRFQTLRRNHVVNPQNIT